MGIQDFIDETTDRLQDEFGNTIPEHHLHSEAQKVVESFYSTHFSEESLPMVINETIGTYGYDWAEYCTSRQLGAMYYKRVK